MALTRGRYVDLIGLNVALLLATSAIGSMALGVKANRLQQHGLWESSKAHVFRPLMGAFAFIAESQSIARNRLDLSAWFGFQQVLLRRPVDLERLSLTIRVEPDGYVNVLYDVRGDGFSGVRFSSRPDLPSVRFHATRDGEFTSQAAVATAIQPGVTHAVDIQFDGARAIVTLDGHPVTTVERVPGPQRIGVRGGQRRAWVDDVVMRLADGSVVHETFRSTGHVVRAVKLFGAGGLLLTIILLASRIFATPGRTAGMWAVLVNVTCVAAASAAYVYEYYSVKPYPDSVNRTILRVEFGQMSVARQQIRDTLLMHYGRPTPGNPYRILFLGSSQTRGAGASRPGDEWVSQLERLLNRDPGRRRIECMNAGVPGLNASQVLDALTDLLPLHPQAAVINLASNDGDTLAFRTSLDSLVARLTNNGIQTVLMMEANSPERRVNDTPHGDLAIKHRIMAEIGRARAVPVIDMHSYLAERNPSGFLWWDFVHLTSYGQRLVAERLYAELPRLLHLP